ncbi:MAG: Na+/H+ antiporter NhaC family protein [Bacteroidetes bacterium]|nr:Na+/H+ antiporter NhaC family protein [Bacteroidota bacterium]
MHKKSISIFIILLISQFAFSQSDFEQQFNDDDFQVTFPSIIVQHVSATIEIIPAEHLKDSIYSSSFPKIRINGEVVETKIIDGLLLIPYNFDKNETVYIQIGRFGFSKNTTPIPLWMSILPPLIAIIMALWIKEVFTALFVGILVGTTMIYFYSGSTFFIAVFQGLYAIIDTYVIESVTDSGHLSIIIFSMLIGAMVNLITKNGGMKGVVNILSKYAQSPRSGQFITWLMGIAIFFDDYANTLVVGNTMRPVTDQLKISREKLAYIVDSTAAPVASIAFITTWIGAELSYIQNGIDTLGLEESAYNIFINSLAYSFYPIFTLIFILMLIYRNVDFGPMFKAEQKARNMKIISNDDSEGFSNKLNEFEISDKTKARWYNAAIPVLVIIIGTFVGLLFTGWDEQVWQDIDLAFSKKISIIIGNADSYKALLWSSLSGVMIALVLTLGQRLMNLKDSIDSLINGLRSMLTAVVILILAWSIALVTQHLHTANFISQTMLTLSISPYLIPTLTFVLAGLVAFSTGSSWGTMAILYPLLLPASWLISQESGLDYAVSMSLFYNVVSGVLAGSVLGDHCSPISDTTILSSLATNCNHIEHVRTQLPYALTVGFVAIFIGTLPAAYGVSSWILFPTGIIFMYIVIRIVGKKVNTTAVKL